MAIRSRPGFILAFCLLIVASPAERSIKRGALLNAENREALKYVSADTIRAHMKFLSDDLLEGRDSGSEGYMIAARYAATQFERMGAKPGGDDGTYFQSVPCVGLRPDPASTLTIRTNDKAISLSFYAQFVVSAETTAPEPFTAPLVFAGYGIVQEAQNRDDYAGLDVKDKVVVVLSGVPSSLPADVQRRAGSEFTKARIAREKGARGLMMIVPESETGHEWDAVLQAIAKERVQLKGANLPQPRRGADARFLAYVRASAAEAMFAGSGKTLAEAMAAADKSGGGFTLATQVEVNVLPARVRELASPNVVAYIPGTDPKLKEQCVLYSAHLDHVGVGMPVNGDGIRNGALDNASGSAAIMAVAEGFAKLKKGPRRTMVFLLVTGEERGFWGSSYYVRNPKFPLSKTAANINIDMIVGWKPSKNLVAMGAEKSSLKKVVEDVCKEMGLTLSPDPFPEKRFFYRSDQIVFARAGIPAMFLQPGFQWEGHTEEQARAIYEEWERTRYHQVGDEIQPDWDFRAFERIAHVAFLIGQRINQDDALPAWNPGDEFEKTRLESIKAGK